MFAQDEVQDSLVLRKAVLQRDAFREHLDPIDGFPGQIVEFRLTREVAIDEYDRHLVAATAARQRAQSVNDIAEGVDTIRVQLGR